MTKPTKWVCAQRRLRSAWASAQSEQSLHCPHEESLGPKLPIERTAKTRIRLGGCPGWSESSLGAQSLCWFCHVATHLSLQVFMVHVRRCVLWWLIRPIVALNCLLQIEHVGSEDGGSDDDPLALALHSLRFRSALQTLLAGFIVVCTLFDNDKATQLWMI